MISIGSTKWSSSLWYSFCLKTFNIPYSFLFYFFSDWKTRLVAKETKGLFSQLDESICNYPDFFCFLSFSKMTIKTTQLFPARPAQLFSLFTGYIVSFGCNKLTAKKNMTPTWFEHATFWSGVRRATVAPRSHVSFCWHVLFLFLLFSNIASEKNFLL